VVFEFSLLGPVSTFADALSVIEMAVKAVGGRFADGCEQDFYAAVQEWLNRSFVLSRDEKENLMKSARLPTPNSPGSFGCGAALSNLWSVRQHQCAIGFNTGINLVYEPGLQLGAASFLRNVDIQATDVRSLVMYMRYLYPDARDIVHEYMRFDCSEEQAGGLTNVVSFDKIWNIPHETLPSDFAAMVTRYARNSAFSHPFLRDILPRLMGCRLYDWTSIPHELRFTLDDGHPVSSKKEYRLDFHTGDIRADGRGVVHRLYSMKRFFVENGNTKLLAELMVAHGIKRTMRFDSTDKVWRIYDSKRGIWRCQLSQFEPQSFVGSFVEEHLEPLIQLESFMGKPFSWAGAAPAPVQLDDDNSDMSEDSDDDGTECGEEETNTSRKRKRSGGATRSFKISAAKYRFGQTLKDQVGFTSRLDWMVLV
jgi:hypothetical protein